MAIPLPKYKQQVRVLGEGVAQTIDPSATIRAAGAGDELMAKIVTDAGGIASDYFNKKAEVQDKATLTRITQEQNNLLSNIEQQKQDALFGKGDYEGNALSINELYEKVTKPELDKFQNKINQIQFNFNENKQKVDASVNNYLQQINTRELVELNRIEIEQYNFDRLQGAFDLEYKTGILQDELEILKKDPVANADQIKKHEAKINANKIAYEEDFKDLERTTKPNVIKEKRSTFAYNALAGQVRQAQLDYKNGDLSIVEYGDFLEGLNKKIVDNQFMSPILKQTLENEIISKQTSANITYSKQINDVENKITIASLNVDGLQETDFVKIKKLYGEELGNKLIDDAVAGQVSNLAIQLDKFPQTQKIINKFTESEDPQSFEEFVLEATEGLGSENGVLVRRLGRVLLREMLEENPTLSAEKVFGKSGKVKAGTRRETISIPYNGRAKQLFTDLLKAGNALDFLTTKDRQEWESKIEGGTLALVEMFSTAPSPQDVTDEMIDAWRSKYAAPVAKKIAQNTSVSTPILKPPTEDEENQRFLDSLGLE